MRLNKYIALCGITSRRKADELIESGKVEVNGQLIKEMGFDVDEYKHIIKVNGNIIRPQEEKIYIMLNKPEGYVTTVKDQFNRQNVIDLVKEIKERIYPIGRLDYETSGLLILTNDGDLTYKLTHPKHEVNKTYIARVRGIPSNYEIKKFEKGLKIEDYITAPAKFKILEFNKDKNYSICEIIIHEGKNRQVRKMCKEIGYPVQHLQRVSMGKINLSNLEKGKWRYLTKEELDYLKSLT
jgi:23S rRNA pseudouridine2605 synthase